MPLIFLCALYSCIIYDLTTFLTTPVFKHESVSDFFSQIRHRYNTVLMEAQEDQHKQARPEIVSPPENLDEYDVILLGYPNWWASIPMPIASFLEMYDFSGKTIIPFCSHGGGRFGQSLTAIAKLAPDAMMGEGLSVHFSGGSTLESDVSAWLDANGIERK